MTQEEALTLAWRFIEFLETGSVPDGLFAPDVFCDFTMPKWRLQAQEIAGLVTAVSVYCAGDGMRATARRTRRGSS